MAGDDPHRPLRDDVRRARKNPGDTLRTHGSTGLFETVERVRMLSKASRADAEEGKFHELASVLSELPVEPATPPARAFAHFLNLANVAEQHHRIRRRRAYLADPTSPPQPGSCRETFARRAAPIGPQDLFDAICKLRVELVLTAHPTEVSRRTLIH